MSRKAIFPIKCFFRLLKPDRSFQWLSPWYLNISLVTWICESFLTLESPSFYNLLISSRREYQDETILLQFRTGNVGFFCLTILVDGLGRWFFFESTIHFPPMTSIRHRLLFESLKTSQLSPQLATLSTLFPPPFFPYVLSKVRTRGFTILDGGNWKWPGKGNEVLVPFELLDTRPQKPGFRLRTPNRMRIEKYCPSFVTAVEGRHLRKIEDSTFRPSQLQFLVTHVKEYYLHHSFLIIFYTLVCIDNNCREIFPEEAFFYVLTFPSFLNSQLLADTL